MHGGAGAVAADVEKLDAGMFEQGRQNPGVFRHVGHFGGARQRQAVLARQIG